MVDLDNGNWAIVNSGIDYGNGAIVKFHIWFPILRSHLSPRKPTHQCMSPNSVYWIDWHRSTWARWSSVFAMHVCSGFSANQCVSICNVLWTTSVYRSLIAFLNVTPSFGCNRFNLFIFHIAICRLQFAILFSLITQSANHYASMHFGSSHDCVCWLCWYKTLAIHCCDFHWLDRIQSIAFTVHDVVYSFHSSATVNSDGTNHWCKRYYTMAVHFSSSW